jgi:hypothetical protein
MMAPVLFNISTEYKTQTLVYGISALVCGISARNDSTVSLVYYPSLQLLFRSGLKSTNVTIMT